MSSSQVSTFQSFLDDAVAKGVAPGFQCVVFNRDKVVYNGVSGFARAPSADSPEGTTFRPENVLWMASCSKVYISLIVLHLIERGLTKTGFTMSDLDSHEALIKVLPEFKHGSGSLVTKILEGYEEEPGPDGRKVMKLRDAKGQITLRMLLTHTAGIAYDWNSRLSELYRPSDGSAPHKAAPFYTGNITDFEVPLLVEPNTAYTYGFACDWVGEFAVRSSGKSLRNLLKEVILEPLGIPPSETDVWISPAMEEARADGYARVPGAGIAPLPRPTLVGYMMEGTPPEGKAVGGGGCVYSTLQAYAMVLRAVLNHDTRIISEETWQLAIKDDLKERGIKVPRPAWESPMPDLSNSVDQFSKSTTEDGVGINLLQCHVATTPTVSGRSAGSFAWAGIPNVYYFIDPAKGVGAVFGTQLIPFYDSQMVEMRDKLEALVCDNLV